MLDNPLIFTDISFYKEALLTKKLKAKDIVAKFIDNIKKTSTLNIVVRPAFEEAINKANFIDNKIYKGEALGSLAGVVFTLKDMFHYKGFEIQAASNMLKNYKCLYTATVVDRLLEQDAIFIGFVNCDEFGMGSSNESSVYGYCANPLDNSRVAGGSSGGSAAAVVANLCHFSLGTDTGGSVRQPASFCGISGYKPSYGFNSRYGVVAFASSFDQVGILANLVKDIPLIQKVIGGLDDKDANTFEDILPLDTIPIKEKKIGYFRSLETFDFDKTVKTRFFDCLQNLKQMGYELVPLDFPYLDCLLPVYYTLTMAEASSNLSRYTGILYGYSDKQATEIEKFVENSRSKGFGAEVKRRILLGTFVLSSGYYEDYFGRAQKIRTLIKSYANTISKKAEILVMPTVTTVAFKIGDIPSNPVDRYMSDIFTTYASIIGCPAVSIPMGTDKDNLPMGFQIIGDYQQDAKVLSWAKELSPLLLSR